MNSNIFSPQGQARHWLLTIFNAKEIENFIKQTEKDFKFWSYQEEECPKTGKIHLQAYFGVDKPIRFKTVKEWFPTAHIEVARSIKQAFAYCQKEETRRVGGLRGHSDAEPSYGGGGGWHAYKESCKRGLSWWDITDEHVDLYAKHEGGCRKLYERFRQFDAKPIKLVVILFGPPGLGKSSTVEAAIGGREHFRMAHGKWWDGYAYEKIVWIDDFHPGSISRAGLLQLMELGDFRMEVKGGTCRVNIEELYITSNWHPEEWFPEKDDSMMKERAQAVIRRAEVKHVTEDGAVTVTASLGNTTLEKLAEQQQNLLKWMKKDREREHD